MKTGRQQFLDRADAPHQVILRQRREIEEAEGQRERAIEVAIALEAELVLTNEATERLAARLVHALKVVVAAREWNRNPTVITTDNLIQAVNEWEAAQ